jgi:putative transposase
MKTPAIRCEIELDEFQIMPNHMHGILIIVEKANGAAVGARRRCVPAMTSLRPHVDPGSIGAIVRAYKSAVTYRINKINHTPGAKIWQRNYYEHVIRDEYDSARIREYIRNNRSVGKWIKNCPNHHTPRLHLAEHRGSGTPLPLPRKGKGERGWGKGG